MQRRRRIYGMIVLALLLACGSAAVTAVIRSYRSTQRLDQALAEWQEAGGKLNGRQLAAAPLPDGQNAAVTYQQAFDGLDRLTPRQIAMLEAPRKVPPAELDQLLDQLQPSLELMRTAAGKPDCAWSIHYELGDYSMRPHLLHVRLAHQLILAHAWREESLGRTQEISPWLELSFELASDIARDPQFVSNAVQRTMDLETLDACEQLYADNGTPSPRFMELVESRHYRQDIQKCFMTEGTIWLTGSGSANSMHQPISLLRWSPELQDQTVEYLRTLRAMGDFFSLPYYQQVVRPQVPRPPQWASLLWQIMGTRREFALSVCQCEARCELARLAVGLRQYKDRAGRYPDALEQLGPVPVDPLSGGPMAYTTAGQGFLVCSVGLSAKGDPVQWVWDK